MTTVLILGICLQPFAANAFFQQCKWGNDNGCQEYTQVVEKGDLNSASASVDQKVAAINADMTKNNTDLSAQIAKLVATTAALQSDKAADSRAINDMKEQMNKAAIQELVRQYVKQMLIEQKLLQNN